MLGHWSRWLIGLMVVAILMLGIVVSTADTIDSRQPVLEETAAPVPDLRRRIPALGMQEDIRSVPSRDLIPRAGLHPTQVNLRVDVFIEAIDRATGKLEPMDGWTLTTAAIVCPRVEISMDSLLPAWFRWCNLDAVNVPARTDADGQATLLYAVDPAPLLAGLGSRLGPPGIHFTPGDGWSFPTNPNGTSHLPRIDIVAPDHWELHISLVQD